MENYKSFLRRWRRSFRLKLAPVGSRRDRWLRERFRSWNKLSQIGWQEVILRILPEFITRPIRDIIQKRRIDAAQPYRLQLDEILKQHSGAGQVIIFPPSLDWKVQLFQRPQQLALALAEQGVLVFYLHPKIIPNVEAFEQFRPRMYLCNVPIETFAVMESPLVYLLTWNRAYAKAFRSPRIIYDYVDEIRVFDGDYQLMVRDHERLVREAHLVLTTAQQLFQATRELRPEAILCPNGVDYSHFEIARGIRQQPPPPDLTSIVARGKPIVGYYGALAVWFDYALVEKLARQRKDISFVIIGPDYDGTLPPKFLDLPNLDWLGVKPYDLLPAYLAYFDVAIIPFLVNEITHATSPLKLFEYMAACKPVVITPMQESMRYDGVLVAAGPDEFSARLDEALMLRDDPTYRRLVDRIARENTWEARAQQILSAIRGLE